MGQAPFYVPPDDSIELKYLRERRQALGGVLPSRPTVVPTMEVPRFNDYRKVIERDYDKDLSTTMGFVRLLSRLCQDKKIGRHIVPIVPDESRTFGMEGMFREVGIYAHSGQLYEPIDSDQLAYYKEATDGQLLEEGISEAGSMSSFCAAGTSYSAHGVNMIPFFIFYSMFGFQRIGDSIWAAADMRAKGFLIGGTAGRTTLNGEGLQHQDGHSLLNAIAFPTVRSYDPAFNYEMAAIVFDGLKRLYEVGETAIYYLMVGNENYHQPAPPDGALDDAVHGMYRFGSREVDKPRGRVQLFGSGAIMNSVLGAQTILAEQFGVASDVWSVTSYTELQRDANAVHRWNMFHPTEKPRTSFIEAKLSGVSGPFVAASDYVRAVSEQIRPCVPGNYYVLGTDGMGRSDTRLGLRRHFEVDAQCVALAALYGLQQQGSFTPANLAKAIKQLDVDPEKLNPLYA